MRAIVGVPRSSFERLNFVTVDGHLVWNGEFKGGTLGVSWLGEEDGYLKFLVEKGPCRVVGHGVVRLPAPRPKAPQTRSEVALDKRDWTASASVPDASHAFSGASIPIDYSAANAIDGDHWTGWRDMTQTQHPGQWFQVDMARPQEFDKIVLDNTWALYDSPEGYAVTVSDDGAHWSKPFAGGHGELGITTITFPLQKARWIRITQTGSNPTYHWSIFEMDVYRGKS
jgi:hypothetical protein